MLKKSLLSLAVTASMVGLAGCNISSTADNNEINQLPLESGTPEYIQENAATLGTTYPLFNPAKTLPTGLVEAPVTLDLLFKGGADADCTDADADGSCDANGKPTTDGTIPLKQGNASLGAEGYNPIFSAVADLDGFSTSAQMDIPFSAAIDASSVIGSGSGATVFVIPLVYPEGEDPLLTSESPTPGAPVAIDASVITFATSTSASVIGTGNVLRISPTAPLNPATRYVIVLTDAIKDSNGKSVIPSPLYSVLSSSANFLTGQDAGTKTRASLQTAIRGYEALASGYFGAAGMSYTADNIVFSFSFTTGGTTAVLNSMASPANYVASAVSQATGEAFNITLPAKYRYKMETALLANSGDADGGITAAVTAVYTQIATEAAGSDAVAIATLAALGADATAQQTALGGAATLHLAIPSPAPRKSDFTTGGAALDLGATLNGAIANDLGLAGTIRVSNGTIKLPYYSGTVDLVGDLANFSTKGANVFDFWKADGTLGTDLSAILTAAGVPATAVTAPSTNVTRLFPLAEMVEYVDVPVSVIYDTACAGNVYTPVIFQHGITADRTSSFMPAAQLATANNCIATVAIDLPMHGLTNDSTISPVSAVTLGAFTAAMGETVNTQRHFGLKRVTGIASKPFPMDDTIMSMVTAGLKAANAASLSGDALIAADAAVDAADTAAKAQADKRGDFFINLESFQSTRDHMRQAVMDLLNLNASLAFMDFNGDGSDSFDTTNVHFIGHSLGAVLGANFVAVNNAVGSGVSGCTTCNVTLPVIKTATLANPGAGVVSLLENSGSFAGTIVGGLEALGTSAGLDLSQGSSLFELTKNVFQATVDSGDSINFASQLKATGTPILTLQIAGDGTTDNPSDQTIPSNTLPGNTVTSVKTYPSLPSYLSGSDPLITALDQTQVSTSQDTSAALNAVVKYTEGEHSSFAGSDAATKGVFAEMMVQLISFISSAGQDVTVTNTAVVQTAP